MGVLLLVRHGQASFGAEDYDVLSPLGEAQALAVGAALGRRSEMPVMHGSLVRQRRTAQIAAQAAGWTRDPVADPCWDELDALSLFATGGQSLDAIGGAAPGEAGRESFQQAFETATKRWTGGEHDAEYVESWPSFQARATAALHDLARLASGHEGDAVVFTSGGPIAAITTRLLDGGAETYLKVLPVVANASITTIVSGRRGLSLVTFNECAHLSADLLTYR